MTMVLSSLEGGCYKGLTGDVGNIYFFTASSLSRLLSGWLPANVGGAKCCSDLNLAL
jgi:hypothetical protein